MASALWKSQDPVAWSHSLKGYGPAVATCKERFQVLDKWYIEELPGALASRKCLLKEELVQLVEWKLMRGKWRPRLLDYAKQQDEEGVKEASRAAMKELEGCGSGPGSTAVIRAALAHLTRLKGVGPATASAALSAMSGHVPFMSDEALEAKIRAYTVPAYMAFLEGIQRKVDELNSKERDEGSPWTAVQCERALWAASRISVVIDDKHPHEEGADAAAATGEGEQPSAPSSSAPKRAKRTK